MPSPQFGARGVVVDAIALAIREAWAVPAAEKRPQLVNTILRRCLGDKMADRVLSSALALLQAQPEAPAGDVEPPAIALLDLCVRCRRVKLREHRRPFRGRVRMEALRDPVWLARQIEQLHRTDEQVAEEVACTPQSVMLWRHKHGIAPPKGNRPWMDAETLRRLIVDQQKAPGEIAQFLGCLPWTVRDWAVRLEVIKSQREFAHHTRSWWAERVCAGWTQYRMAQAAGVATNVVPYHLRKWDLYNPDRASKRRGPSYPQLYEPGWLRARLGRGRGTIKAIATQVGCSPTAVTAAARKLGLLERTPARPCPWKHDPAWYRERFGRRMTAEQIAAEVGGLTVKSVLNYMGELDLLEEYHQRVDRWSPKRLRETRERTLHRQRAMLLRERRPAAVA